MGQPADHVGPSEGLLRLELLREQRRTAEIPELGHETKWKLVG